MVTKQLSSKINEIYNETWFENKFRFVGLHPKYSYESKD